MVFTIKSFCSFVPQSTVAKKKKIVAPILLVVSITVTATAGAAATASSSTNEHVVISYRMLINDTKTEMDS